MAGHSKWKNIQHRKGAQDAKKGKVFTKIALEITVAARFGGGDPDDNARLRVALTKARAANMPKDNCLRAIKKGVGDASLGNYMEKTYEGYGPAGAALIVECLTDNANRTVGDVRHAFTRSGGNLGTDGSVGWMFQRKGMIVFDKEQIKDEEKLFEVALENGAEDVKEEHDQYIITSTPENFMSLKTALDEISPDACFCEVTMVSENQVTLDEHASQSLEKLVNILEDNDDVQNVYHNAILHDS